MLIFTTMKTTTNDIALAKRLYPEYNAKYFDSECPQGLAINEKALGKNVLASVHTSYDSKGNLNFDGMFFNSRFELTVEQLKSLLLHEMVHVWLFVQGITHTKGGGYHGQEFQDKRQEVESESGITVPKTEDASQIKVNDKILSKPVYGLYMRYQGQHSVTKVAEKMASDSNINALVSWAEDLAKRVQAKEAWVFEVSGMDAMHKLPANHALDKPKLYPISSEELKELKDKAEIVRQIR